MMSKKGAPDAVRDRDRSAVAGVAAGLPIGRMLRARRERDYWIANGAAVLLAVVIAAVGQTFAVPYMEIGRAHV
jgi:hypothetical protein